MSARRIWCAVGGAMLLAACAGQPQPQTGSNAPEPAEPVAGTDLAVAALPEPTPGLTPGSAPDPVPDVQAFMNRTGVNIAMVLGEPGFVRRDPPAELWQYRTSECTLDLFLYDDGYGDYRLVHFDFRGATFTGSAEDECLRRIVELTGG